MKTKWILLALVLTLPAAGAYAANDNLSRQDMQWVKNAHQVNMEEIKAGKAAEQKGQASIVQKAGRTLVSDHKMLDSQLTRAAHQLGVSLPDSVSAEQEATLKMVKSKSGDKFDKVWVRTMIMGHQKAINKTQKEIDNASSQKVKSLAKKTLPVLQKHLNLLQHAQSKVK